ncbi:putative quinol monooxygenase [Nitrosomonas sp.]|uniref:putative quinol monooxygenase n=1 Tax=Nitrosomonas sp. TaxID=42353 RepID=UPI001D1D89F8|nr:putative quinol monooxygenase [Nitrosomonas sp.]MBX3615950.1 antibiotic biosynthesis monooxygenase [Nitrosomonas sp.]
MSKETIRVIAEITARVDKVAAVEAILKKIIVPTRQENGCLSYQLFRRRNHTAEFLFIEEWTDEKAVDAHFKTPHLQEALNQVTPLLAKAPNIQKYTWLA